MTSGSTPSPAPRDLRGSVRMKVGLIVGGAMLLVLGATMFISTQLVVRLFGAQQDNLTREKLERVMICLNKLGEIKIKQVRDNAEWDEAYSYVEGNNPYFLNMNYGAYVNTSGQDVVMVFDRARNLVGAAGPRLRDASLSVQDLDLNALIHSRLFQGVASSGLVVVNDEVLMLACCPINNSNLTAQPNGWLIFGTLLDNERTTEIADLAGARLRVSPLAELPPLKGPVMEQQFRAGVYAPTLGLYEPASTFKQVRSEVRTMLVLPTLTGAGVGVEVWASMLVYSLALQTKSWMIVLACVVALILLAVGLSAFEFSILQPLAALDREMRRISSSESPEAFLEAREKNEIGRLAQSANRLLNRVRAGRREAEKQRELLSSVLNSASEGVVAFLIKRDLYGETEDFVYVLVNASAEKMIGRKAESLIGRTLLSEFPAMKSLGVFDRYCRVVKTNQPESFEVYFDSDGIKAWFQISASPWKEGLVLTFEDISESKEKQAQLQSTLKEIERFNASMIGREERIIEMKKEVNALRGRLGQPAIYNSPSEDV